MRAFVIADASKRKARPVALLLWEPDDSNGQGKFSLELASGCEEGDLPLSLSFCARREKRRATSEESEEWVRSRIVPEDRHNIAEVLLANGLTQYDEVGLLAACGGRSSDDDYRAYEVELPEEGSEWLVEPDPLSIDVSLSRADRVISAVERRRYGAEVRYALVELPCDGYDVSGLASTIMGDSEKPTAAQRIGGQIRSMRIEAGLTQNQLAARAGITQTVMSRTESGAGNPTLALLEEIACALGAQLDVRLNEGERQV